MAKEGQRVQRPETGQSMPPRCPAVGPGWLTKKERRRWARERRRRARERRQWAQEAASYDPQDAPTPREIEQAILDALALYGYPHEAIPDPDKVDNQDPIVRTLIKEHDWLEDEAKQTVPALAAIGAQYWPDGGGVPERWLIQLTRNLLRSRRKGKVTDQAIRSAIRKLVDTGKADKTEGTRETLDGKRVRETVYRLSKKGARPNRTKTKRSPRPPKLTKKQTQAWMLRNKGLAFEQIAKEMNISRQAATKLVKKAEKAIARASCRSVPTQTLPTDRRGQVAVAER